MSYEVISLKKYYIFYLYNKIHLCYFIIPTIADLQRYFKHKKRHFDRGYAQVLDEYE